MLVENPVRKGKTISKIFWTKNLKVGKRGPTINWREERYGGINRNERTAQTREDIIRRIHSKQRKGNLKRNCIVKPKAGPLKEVQVNGFEGQAKGDKQFYL